jgi:hypothetical protein
MRQRTGYQESNLPSDLLKYAVEKGFAQSNARAILCERR